MALATHDRYGFAIDVLDGAKNSNKILADLLEEAGERGAAQWARSRKGKRQKRLHFVLSILPVKTALALGCDFADHVARGDLTPDGQEAIDTIRAWANGGATTADSRAALRALSASVGSRYAEIGHWAVACVESLKLAAEIASRPAGSGRPSDAKESKRRAEDVNIEVRRLARFAQFAATPERPRERTWGWSLPRESRAKRDPSELKWQIERTRQVLLELLEAASQ